MINRRTFIRTAAAAAVAAGLPLPALSLTQVKPLRLTAADGEVTFSAEQENPTRVMHYNQSIPGPLIRLRQGQEAAIDFHNGLAEDSSVHWHGLRIANAMDGVAGMTQPPVKPGETFEYRFTPPDAGTYWYHSHQRSWAQLAAGLAGVLIVDEKEPPRVDQDLVFAIDDWRVDRAMQFDSKSLGSLHDWAHGGRLGNFITVNGNSEQAYAVARGQRIRLRLVNIANARVMYLIFHEPEMSIVALDGQPVKPYRPEGGRIRLAPGQRADLIIDLAGDPGSRSPIEAIIGEYAYEIAYFDYADKVRREQPLDDAIELPPNPISKTQLPKSFEHFPLLMQGGAMGGMREAIYFGEKMDLRTLARQYKKVWALNGIVGVPDEPLFRVPRGTAVSIDVDNDNRWPHAMHVHGHHFVHDKSPEIWRDSFLFERGESGAMSFIADNPGKWLIHCHMVEHMAAGMATWFEVV